MNKKILTIAMIALFSLGLTALANTIFSIDDAFFTETGISSGDYSPLNFNYGGNNFDGIIFLGDKVNNTGELTLGGNIVNCDKQIKGLYVNTARGNKIWPLDQSTLDILSGSSSFAGYNQLTMTGGFFTECVGSGFTVDENEIYGYISHEYAGETFELWAGIDYDFANNMGTGAFSGSLKYITGILNDTAEGYIFDDHGGIADVISNLDIYGDIELTGSAVTYTGSSTYAVDDDVETIIYSNKDATFEISGDVASISTGTITAGSNLTQNIVLSNGNGTKTVVFTIDDGTDTYTETLTIILSIPDTTPPTVNLTYPINGGLSMINSLQFQWTCNDTDVDHFDLHINSSNSGASYVWTNLNPSINSMMVNNMLDDDYTWYVIGTDTSGNTGQSAIYYLTISGVAVGPDLVSPANNANIEFGSLILDWENTNSASGYTWQIATDSSFVNIVASDTTIGTAVQTIHNPNFMTGSFYWRIIDNATNGISTYRKVNITTPSGGIDLKTDEFEFSDKNNAEISESYISNHITIEGINNNVYIPIKLEDSIGALFINDNMVGSQGLAKLNDEVYVELISSNMYNSLVSTKLIIGDGNNKVSDEYDVITKTGVNNNGFTLSYTQKLQAIMLVQSIIDMYGNNQTKLIQFLTTFQAIIQDKSDLLKIDVLDTNDPQELELLNGQIASLDYLYDVITDYLNNLPHGVDDIYIAPSGKQYRVVFDENRFAYTSPDFIYPKFFPTWELFTQHIDINNPGDYSHNYHGGSSTNSNNGEKIKAPNSKVYYIHVSNSKRTSDQFTYTKYFDTRDEIVNYIYANNPADTWNHRIDTSFTPVEFIAQNGKKYSIFKTLASGPNGNKYSSFNFVTPKYFDSLQAAKNHIMDMNR